MSRINTWCTVYCWAYTTRPPNGTNLESDRDSLRSPPVAVVSLDDTRLFVDATLRATLRTEAEDDWTCEGVPVLVWFLFNTEVRSEPV